MKNRKFAFTVHHRGVPWDVYYFKKDNKAGTLAFSKQGEKWVIGVLQEGNLSESDVIGALGEEATL